jgi:hypothetical protein
MQSCSSCKRSQPEINRFCTHCGRRLDRSGGEDSGSRPDAEAPEQMNIAVLYGMVAALILAVLCPPWETSPDQQPEFLGLSFILSPPTAEAVVSRMLLTIELVTIAIAGFYGAFLMRKK